jgi:hypothetical protein
MKINLKRLKEICAMPIADFAQFGETSQTPDGQLVYVPRGEPILGVCHLDTVHGHDRFEVVPLKGDTVLYNSQLDDRLGAYVLLELLPQLGVKCDLLLTEGEETGRSTAKHFVPPEGKTYNWCFEFDRRGMDVVMYQYESKKMVKLLHRHKFKVGVGSSSDIAYLGHLGVKCFNFGTGYHEEHGADAHANLGETERMVKKFAAFANAERDNRFAHDRSKEKIEGRFRSRLDLGDDDDDFRYDWDPKIMEFRKTKKSDVPTTTSSAQNGRDEDACVYCGCTPPHHTEGCPAVTYAE